MYTKISVPYNTDVPLSFLVSNVDAGSSKFWGLKPPKMRRCLMEDFVQPLLTLRTPVNNQCFSASFSMPDVQPQCII